jgi:hypothetical protein
MAEYEIINEDTGEIETFKTGIDIKQLEEYNQWKIEQMLNPPTYSPQEYANFVESEEAKRILAEAKDYLSFYNKGSDWPPGLIETLERILDGREK